MLKTALEQAVAGLIPPVTVALGGLLCALVAYGISFLKSRTTNTKVQGALDRLDQATEDAVKDAEQRIVGSIKPGDDLAKSLADAKASALAAVKAHYGEKGIDELKKILGWDDVDANLSTKIEAKVHDVKLDKAASCVDDTAPNKILPTTTP